MVKRIIVALQEGQNPADPGSLRLSSGSCSGYWFYDWWGIPHDFDNLFNRTGGLHEEEVLEVLCSEGMTSWN